MRHRRWRKRDDDDKPIPARILVFLAYPQLDDLEILMADVTLLTDQNVTGTVAIEATDGTLVTVPFDAGTFAAAIDNTTDFEVTSAPDDTTVTVKALGTATTADATLTVAGSVGGVALEAFTTTFAATVPAPVAAKIAVTFAAPVAN